MARILGRLLIVDGQRDFACLVGAIAERLGFATRILLHTLDFDYVMQHWHPDVVALQVAMPDQQDVDVLKYLGQSGFQGRLVLIAEVNKGDLEWAVNEARKNGLTVASTLMQSSPSDQIEAALKLLLDLQHAA
jgi:DNA-binding NtrC family response regulator